MAELDTEYTEQPKCPHCGKIRPDYWELFMSDEYGDGSQCHTTCGSCHKDYCVTLHLTSTYTTEKE